MPALDGGVTAGTCHARYWMRRLAATCAAKPRSVSQGRRGLRRPKAAGPHRRSRSIRAAALVFAGRSPRPAAGTPPLRRRGRACRGSRNEVCKSYRSAAERPPGILARATRGSFTVEPVRGGRPGAHYSAICWRCPVRQECADYAVQVPSWGLWGAESHGGEGEAQSAA
jgi:hypothetical protein